MSAPLQPLACPYCLGEIGTYSDDYGTEIECAKCGAIWLGSGAPYRGPIADVLAAHSTPDP